MYEWSVTTGRAEARGKSLAARAVAGEWGFEAGAGEGFSGAIVAGLYTAFNAKQQLTTEVLLLEIQGTRPLSVTRAEEVASIREWAKTRAVPAG